MDSPPHPAQFGFDTSQGRDLINRIDRLIELIRDVRGMRWQTLIPNDLQLMNKVDRRETMYAQEEFLSEFKKNVENFANHKLRKTSLDLLDDAIRNHNQIETVGIILGGGWHEHPGNPRHWIPVWDVLSRGSDIREEPELALEFYTEMTDVLRRAGYRSLSNLVNSMYVIQSEWEEKLAQAKGEHWWVEGDKVNGKRWRTKSQFDKDIRSNRTIEEEFMEGYDECVHSSHIGKKSGKCGLGRIKRNVLIGNPREGADGVSPVCCDKKSSKNTFLRARKLFRNLNKHSNPFLYNPYNEGKWRPLGVRKDYKETKSRMMPYEADQHPDSHELAVPMSEDKLGEMMGDFETIYNQWFRKTYGGRKRNTRKRKRKRNTRKRNTRKRKTRKRNTKRRNTKRRN